MKTKMVILSFRIEPELKDRIDALKTQLQRHLSKKGAYLQNALSDAEIFRFVVEKGVDAFEKEAIATLEQERGKGT